MSERILVVEDDPTLQETLAYNLARQGYLVDIAGDGHTAIESTRENSPDLMVLDIMPPILDGFEVCRILRQESNVLILMLTARDNEIDRIIGLEMGADDYLTKPFSMREFLAWVKAQLRRIRLDREQIGLQANQDREILQFGNLILDMTRREVRIDETPISLKPKEFELLLFLAKHRGQVLTRELILERVWGWDFSGGSRTVDVHVRWLREKIELDIYQRTDQIRDFSFSKPSDQLIPPSEDEICQFARVFNDLVAQLRFQYDALETGRSKLVAVLE